MKQKLTPLFIGLCALSLVTTPLFADPAASTLKPKAKKIVHHHKAKVHTAKKIHHPKMHKMAPIVTIETLQGPESFPPSSTNYLPVDIDVPGQSFVSSGPYIGVPLEYSGAHLIVNSPSVNQDIALLKMRNSIHKRLAELGRPEIADHSHILLSGMAEGQAIYNKTSNSSHTSDIDVTTVNLDAYILGPSNWTSALLELTYDNGSGTSSGSFSSNSRALNSRILVNKAFVVLGDFRESPFYLSFGQMYVPFGAYSTSLVSSPLTKALARTKARAIVVGADPQVDNAIYGAAYVFKGDSHATKSTNINNAGMNVGVRFKTDNIGGSLTGGAIANIADSVGMQDTGNQPLFAGFGGQTIPTGSGGSITWVTTGNEVLVHRVQAYNLRGKLNIGSSLNFIGEYVAAGRHFSALDLTFNGNGARPRALSVEAIYTLPLSKPTSLTLAYGMTKEALALGLPAKRYSFAVNTSFWKNTLESLEFRRDVDYASSASSSGSTLAGPNGTGTFTNVVTAQFDFYF